MMYKLEQFVRKISSYINAVAMATCFAMMLLMASDVVARFVFTSAILGAYELTENFMVVVVGLSFAYTQMKRRHICVDVLTNILPRKAQNVLECVCMLISAGLIGVFAYAQFLQTISVEQARTTSTVLRFSLWPFNLILAIGMTVFFIATCLHLVFAVTGIFRNNEATPPANMASPNL
jgi:TRAP-type C4-dicarboxylate transport system permease small subunit